MTRDGRQQTDLSRWPRAPWQRTSPVAPGPPENVEQGETVKSSGVSAPGATRVEWQHTLWDNGNDREGERQRCTTAIHKDINGSSVDRVGEPLLT